MRHLVAATAVVGFLAAGVACAQLKTQVQSPGAKTSVVAPAPQATATLESARRIKREEAIKLVKEGKGVFVDVRGKDQYDLGHIKGAINIPLSELMTRLKDLPPKKFIITYCA